MLQVQKMREADIPLEGAQESYVHLRQIFTSISVMWNDIDLYHAYRDFTTDPVTFPLDQVRTFIRQLVSSSFIVSTALLVL